MAGRVTREISVTQSIQDFIRAALTARGFPMAQVEMQEAFNVRQFEGPVDKEYVALGFNFDVGGQPIEIGSNLRRYHHNIEVFVVATSAARGSSLAYAIRDDLEGAPSVPLKDLSQSGAPVIDYLHVDPVRVERQPIPDPEPWQEFIWLVVIPVIDDYDPTG